jgi:hypothetical protein
MYVISLVNYRLFQMKQSFHSLIPRLLSVWTQNNARTNSALKSIHTSPEKSYIPHEYVRQRQFRTVSAWKIRVDVIGQTPFRRRGGRRSSVKVFKSVLRGVKSVQNKGERTSVGQRARNDGHHLTGDFDGTVLK